MRLRLPAFVAALVAGALPVTAAPAAAAPRITIDRGPSPRQGQTALVSVVGDSLTYGSAPGYDMRTRAYSLALDALLF